MASQRPKLAIKVDDKFLIEWLANFETEQKEFDAQNLPGDQLESLALRTGYRTYRIARECLRTQHRLLKMFVSEAAFKRLWLMLNQCDQSMEGGTGFSFSPANGGFPFRLLRQVEWWYQIPKFTKREREAVLKKMIKACDVLLLHLGQLSAGGPLDSFAQLNHLEPWQLEELYRGLSTKEIYEARLNAQENRGWPKLGYGEKQTLRAAGITPTFAIQSLRGNLERDPHRMDRAPTKVRATGAMKTHFIGVVDRMLDDATVFLNCKPAFELQHIAELVSLIADSDCSVDDVQKARIQNRNIEARRSEDFHKELKESSIGN